MKSRRSRLWRLAPLSLLALSITMLSACGGASAGSASIPTATTGPKMPHAGKSADQILAGLKAKGLPIGVHFTYDATTDQNHLLGRPGQYIGKLNFKDTRIQSSETGADISVDDGGSIEVFDTTAHATNRAKYVEAIAQSSSLFAEYDYLDGVVLLRISKQLTPTQAAAYEKALKALP